MKPGPPVHSPNNSRRTALGLVTVLAAFALPALGSAMEIQWTRMSGQWPVEASALVGKFDGGAKDQILVLNRGGQLLLWTSDGAPLGAGQDGTIAQLPLGRWTTAPTLMDGPSATRFVTASVEGQVIGLDEKFHTLWQHRLPGETVWGRAMPAILRTGTGPGLVFSDASGTVTCLSAEGRLLWTNALAAGPSKAPAQVVNSQKNQHWVLAPSGSTLFCCDVNGAIRWSRKLAGEDASAPGLGQEIVTRPEILLAGDKQIILCGTVSGMLFALGLDGKVLWECKADDTLSGSIAFLPRRGSTALILVTGLWGNLHAIDLHGRHVWTHLFRSKVRGAPLVLDADGDGRFEVFVPTFHQQVFQFDDQGELRDDIRLSGIMPSALTPFPGSAPGRADLLVTTTTLLAYRLRPGSPESQYGTTEETRELRISLCPTSCSGPGTNESLSSPKNPEPSSLLIDNPKGGLINVCVSMTDKDGWKRISGRLTSRSALELPLPDIVRTGKWAFRVTARDSAGKLLDEKAWKRASGYRGSSSPGAPASSPARIHDPKLAGKDAGAPGFRAWSTFPYGAFEESRLNPSPRELVPGRTNQISVDNLYLDEADQAAFIVASDRDESTQAKLTLARPARKDGVAFGGNIVVREVIPTGSVNGEQVPDALPALNDAGLVTLLPHRSVKIWLSVDSHGADPGDYSGTISIKALSSGSADVQLPLRIEVLDLRLPKELPLKLCTWDYVPNRWFGSRTREVLDDMGRHGVNLFPRSTIPAARVDAAGALTIDWTPLDAELTRLEHRGQILFQLNHPPIESAVPGTPGEKRPLELQYIRSLRDHLREHGFGYADYAFYLLDEPGLDYGTNVPVLLDAGKLFREADPKLRTYTDPVPGLSWKDFERIEPLVDVWAPNMRLVSGLLSGDQRVKRIMNASNVWSYECVGQVKSLSPLRYNRANAWRAKFFGLNGIGFWTHSTTEADLWYRGKTSEEEYALVYPGALPVPSARWEAVRDGLEDVAAIALLEQQIRRHREAGTQSELVKEADEKLRIALRDIMELSDETFVESRDFLRQGDRVLGHTWTDVELFRRHRAAIARLTRALAHGK